MLDSPGIRVSFSGFILFLVSATLLLFLPDLVAVPGMLLGGLTVWAGFMMTLFAIDKDRRKPEDEASPPRSN